jgi:4-hydroxybenzoate polyprenyltransferase
MPAVAPDDSASKPSIRDQSRSTGAARTLALALSDIKIAHSVFALPFALLASFIAATGSDALLRWPRFAAQLALIVLCMVLARTWAMLVNRLADARFDADNPRTARRALASGRLAPPHARIVALAAAFAFILATAAFAYFNNLWPLALSVPVLAWIALYSYTKRFTWACHLFLGGALAASPLAAAIAINPDALLNPSAAGTRPALLLLSAFVLCWVAGFDVAYALQDIDFDRRTGLHSIPARLGLRGALRASRAFHLIAFIVLVFAARADPRFGPIMLAASLAVAAILLFEHITLQQRGVAGLPLAFFTLNGVVSCLLGAAGITDILI